MTRFTTAGKQVIDRAFKSIVRAGSQKGKFTKEMVLALPSTPIMSPSYPRGLFYG